MIENQEVKDGTISVVLIEKENVYDKMQVFLIV